MGITLPVVLSVPSVPPPSPYTSSELNAQATCL